MLFLKAHLYYIINFLNPLSLRKRQGCYLCLPLFHLIWVVHKWQKVYWYGRVFSPKWRHQGSYFTYGLVLHLNWNYRVHSLDYTRCSGFRSKPISKYDLRCSQFPPFIPPLTFINIIYNLSFWNIWNILTNCLSKVGPLLLLCRSVSTLIQV